MPPYLVDSHCHLNYPDFKDDLDSVITTAYNQGVKTLLTVNTKLSEAADLKAIAETYDNVYFSVGVHPHEAAAHQGIPILETLKELMSHPKAVGIGETGLDYYYDHSPRQIQISCFEHHLQAATDLDLPVIIHTRDADNDTISCLDHFPKARGVFHCFSGSADLAVAALERDYYLSFSGIITFKNAEVLRQVVAATPLNRILVETDSPFLAPLPHRGKRNEPVYTRLNAEKVAEIKGISCQEVAEQTTKNFFTVFNKAVQQAA